MSIVIDFLFGYLVLLLVLFTCSFFRFLFCAQARVGGSVVRELAYKFQFTSQSFTRLPFRPFAKNAKIHQSQALVRRFSCYSFCALL
jgi:hypothetical protein